MKKTFIVVPMMTCFLFLAHFASAQVSELKLINNSACPVTVQVTNNDGNCNAYCTSALTTVPANSMVSIQLNCLTEDKNGSTQVDIMDNQSAIRIGNGCGLPNSDGYLDCSSTPRTATMFGAGVAVIN